MLVHVNSLKLGLEEAYFLSHVFGLLSVAKQATPNEYYSLQELWTHFCKLTDENDSLRFAARYASYYYLRSKGWIVRNGFKYGVDYLVYKEGPPFYHALFSVIVSHSIDDQLECDFKWNEISALTRVTQNSAKQLLRCIVTIPKSVTDLVVNGPECITGFSIDLVHINRWNLLKGEFNPAKCFYNGST